MIRLLFLIFGLTPLAGGDEAGLIIDPGTTHQTLEGFGASGAWWHTWFHDLEKKDQEQALDLLFTEQGADLSIFRYNLPSGSGDGVTDWKRRTADVETAPFRYDLERDPENLEILRRVIARGVDEVVFFSNSPPRRLTRTGMTSGGEKGGSNLAEGAEDELARYLVDLTDALMKETGLKHARLSPVNEPQWRWGEDRRHQDGCHYTPAQVAAVGRAVIEEIEGRRDQLTGKIGIELFDSGSWEATPDYARVIWDDPVIARVADGIAIHSYWSDADQKRKARAWLDRELPDLPVRMTEYCEMRGGHDPGMRSALNLARTVHEDMTIGRVTEWTWWLALSDGRYCDGLLHAMAERRGGPRQLETTKRFWALANWSRFVRPGWQRVTCDGADSRLLVTAFASPTKDRLACVVVNPGEEAVAFTEGVRADGYEMESAWRTDEEHDLAKTDVPITLPGRSVTTVLLRKLN